MLKIIEQRTDRKPEDGSGGTATSNQTGAGGTSSVAAAGAQTKVNKTIQMLAQQYCNECKTSFEELSKIIQRVLVSRKELVTYDRKHRDMEPPKTTPLLRVCDLNKCSLFFFFYYLNFRQAEGLQYIALLHVVMAVRPQLLISVLHC